ncbi:ras-like GTP-binding protein RhoL [Cimex lectularius]|uniref:Ras-like GTP-binding protein RhoL n=1 Tax=Cimex lectularius TaxID=79782 RepID=A0A8I6S0X1_CIMLE|nr:ras-like GTP-binding protein RhoL [Cimex lectularius]
MVKDKVEITNKLPLKITAVGDGMVGKTCLLITYTTQRFPTEYVPTVFDNYATSMTVDGQEYDTTLWDTAGQEDYERLRPLTYPNTDCFLLCFSVGTRASYDNIYSKWYPELKQFCPNVPIIIVATKIDLRETNEDALMPADGKKMKKKIKAFKYMECSALKVEGLSEIFTEAVRACIKHPRKKHRGCPII